MSTESSSPGPQADAPSDEALVDGLSARRLGALNLAADTVLPDESTARLPTLTPEELAPHFPQLEILECLGRGGMGVVYKARQKSLNRLVALKLLAPERADDPLFAARFEKEAHALAALNHPNIVGVHDFGSVAQSSGLPSDQPGGLNHTLYFLLMEFVDGVNLRQLLQAKRLTPKEALSIVPPVCDALQCAHDHGIVHRDIKPENLLIDKSGTVKIADFGIAKMYSSPLAPREEHSASANTQDSRTAEAQRSGESPQLISRSEMATFGTPDYAAPEQSNGTADHRADIYSLGVVLYEMLTGERPKEDITPPSKRVQVDIRIDEIVLRALEKTPELRFATAADFRKQVEAAGREQVATTWRTAILLPLLVFVILDALLVSFVFLSSRALPAKLATHFNFKGKADGWMSADKHMLYTCLMPMGTLAFFGLLSWLLWRFPSTFQLNVPNKTYWMKPENRGRALGIIYRSFLWMSCLLTLFFGAMHWQVVQANQVSPPTFPSGPMIPILIIFFTLMIVWIVQMILSFTQVDLPKAAKFRTQVEAVADRPREAISKDSPAPTSSPLTYAAMFFVVLSAILGSWAWLRMLEPSLLVVFSILASALLGVLLAIPVRQHPRGKQALLIGSINAAIWLILAIVGIVAQIKPAATPAVDVAGFEPVIELELSANDSLKDAFLDLDTGKVMSAPKELVDSLRAKGWLYNGAPSADSIREWMQSSGVDLIARVGNPGEPSNLSQMDGISWGAGERLPQPDGYTFDTVTAEGLRRFPALFEDTSSSTQTGGPWAYPPSVISGFKTREGRLGILEILEARPGRVTIRYKLVQVGKTNAGATKAATPQTPRQTVAEFLRRLKAPREKNADTKDIWDLTTRSTNASWGLDFLSLGEYDHIQPAHQLGNAEQTMVLSAPFHDNAGRLRVFHALLLKHDDKWLINSHGHRPPAEVASLVDGFKLSPGVKFDVQPAELVGQWTYPCASSLTMAADGTGVQIYEGPSGVPEKPQSFKWDVSGSTLRRHWPDRVEMLDITWMDADSFHIIHLDGPAKGYTEGFHRRTADPQEAKTNGTATSKATTDNVKSYNPTSTSTDQITPAPSTKPTVRIAATGAIERKVDKLQNDLPFNDPPKLRYVAWLPKDAESWQMHTTSGEPVKAHGDIPTEAWDWWKKSMFDGQGASKVTNTEGYLMFFYSHPAIDERSDSTVKLHASNGSEIECRERTSIHHEPKHREEDGWFAFGCLVPYSIAGQSVKADIELTAGTWHISDPMPVGEVNRSNSGGVLLTNQGDNTDHHAFVTVSTGDEDRFRLPQWEVLGKLKTGDFVSYDGSTGVGNGNGGFIHTINFHQPLSEFASFLVRSREQKTFPFDGVQVPSPPTPPK